MSDYNLKDFEHRSKGTRTTMAPQYAINNSHKNWKVDIYAIGVILYEIKDSQMRTLKRKKKHLSK